MYKQLHKNIPENVKFIMQTLLNNNYKAYIIGGAVRDLLLNIEPHDWDIFTNATGKQILDIFPAGKVIGNDVRQRKILTVIVNGIEVSQFRSNPKRTETGDDLKTHLSTCDATINALAMDINGNITDMFGGISHLNHPIHICAVGNAQDRIHEDKLRIFRYIRFMLKYKGIISCTIEKAISKTIISDIPKENIRDELLKIIVYPGVFGLLHKYKLLSQIFPYISKLEIMNGGENHNETVLEHMILASECAQALTKNPILILAAFLHDIGKAVTFSCGPKYITKEEYKHQIDNNEIHFYSHEKEGYGIAKDWLKKYKFKNNDKQKVSKLVKYHMFYFLNRDMETGIPSKKHCLKVFKDLDSSNISIEELITVFYCDSEGNRLKRGAYKFSDFIIDNKIHKEYYKLKFAGGPFTVKDLVISGKDLITHFNMEPGIKIGKILNELFDKVQCGYVENTRKDLLYNARQLLRGSNNGK